MWVLTPGRTSSVSGGYRPDGCRHGLDSINPSPCPGRGQIRESILVLPIIPLRSGRNQLAPQARQPLTSQLHDGAGNAQLEQVVHLVAPQNVDVRARRKAEGPPAAQAGGIVVRHLADDDAVPGPQVAEPLQVAVTQLPAGSRDRVPVRILQWFPEMGREGLLQPRGDGVLEGLGLGVHLAPVESQDAGEEQLDEAMSADDAAGFGEPAAGELGPAAGLVLDKPVFRQLLEHAGDGRGPDAEGPRDVIGGGDAARSADGVDRFQVILHGRGERSRHAADPGCETGTCSIATGASAANGGPAGPEWTAHATQSVSPYSVRSPAWADTHQSVRCKSPRPSSTAFFTSTATMCRGSMYPSVTRWMTGAFQDVSQCSASSR